MEMETVCSLAWFAELVSERQEEIDMNVKLATVFSEQLIEIENSLAAWTTI